MSYTVTEVKEGAVEIWDGRSRVEPDRLEKSTMILSVGQSDEFMIGDVVDVVVVLRSRKDPT